MRKASTTFYPTMHLEIARYVTHLRLASPGSRLPHLIDKMVGPPPEEYRKRRETPVHYQSQQSRQSQSTSNRHSHSQTSQTRPLQPQPQPQSQPQPQLPLQLPQRQSQRPQQQQGPP